MNQEISLEEKLLIGSSLSVRLSESGLALSRDFIKIKPEHREYGNRTAVARGYLVAGSQLSGQIIKGCIGGSVGLSLIGCKTLLEYTIGSEYIFNHPKHKGDFNRIDLICEDIFNTTNTLQSHKHKICGTTVKDRMESLDRKDLYEKNYAALNDYAHLVLRQNMLNDKNKLPRIAVDVISQSLCGLAGIIDSVNICFELGWDTLLMTEVISYRDKYESLDPV